MTGYVSAQTIIRGYLTTDELLVDGMAVQISLDKDDGPDKYVERAHTDSKDKIVGITVHPNDSFAAIGSSSDQVFVQSTGEVLAYVSDVNGNVNKGDVLSISPLRGILMKADETTVPYVALAVEGFSSTEAEQKTTENGEIVDIHKISVSLDSQGVQQPEAGSGALASLGKAVVGRDVGEVKVIIALVLFIILLVIEGSILYGSISSSLQSIGRNPLAKKAIKKEFLRVLLLAMAMLLVGLGVIYTVLWV